MRKRRPQIRCDGWVHRGTVAGIPHRQCARLASQLFVWWPDDDSKRVESLLCFEHALQAERDAVGARVPFNRKNPYPPEYAWLEMLREGA